MHGNPDRIEQFKQEIADMRVRDPATSKDRLLLRLGAAGLLAGPVLAIVAWFVSHGTDNALQQRDAIVLALIGVTVAIAGAALWLKAALAGFLRFWLARLIYEEQARADRTALAVNSSPDPRGDRATS